MEITKESVSRDDRLLFSTEQGSVRHCACRDVLVLVYRGHWLAMTRVQYREFHARMIEVVRCPLGRRRLNEGSSLAFRTPNGALAFHLDAVGMEDLLWLLDSARFMLEAQDAAGKGFQSLAS